MVRFVRSYFKAVFDLFFPSDSNVHIHRFHLETRNSIQIDKTVVLVSFTDSKLNFNNSLYSLIDAVLS